MNKKNQISIIKEFINSNEETLLINQVNDDISMFYMGVLKYYANDHGVKISNDPDTDFGFLDEDLFGTRIILSFNITSAKKLSDILDVNSKKIIFTDYKNYKKFSLKFNSINGYQFENDIVFFIKNELNIHNEELLDYCKNNAALLFSETSKYLINNNLYSRDRSLIEEKNHILDIRKSIFENKRNNLNIQILYQNIKKEAEYKKLNFLTY
jgi:hypothetical protein